MRSSKPAPPTAPNSEAELLLRAKSLAGRSLEEIAGLYHLPVPADLDRAKGWVGRLFEYHLGAPYPNRPEPDFNQWGIEVKSLPLNQLGQPKETTYVCTAPIASYWSHHTIDHNNQKSEPAQEFPESQELYWKTSRVYQKLARILWIPVEADLKIPLLKRKIGCPILWELKDFPALEKRLKKDWEELMDYLQLGSVDTLTAHRGLYLQIRPKAADSTQNITTFTQEGEKIRTTRKGFYLRTTFTQQIIANSYWNAVK